MKRKYMLIILVSAILGTLLGGVLRESRESNDSNLSKDIIIRKEMRKLAKSAKKLNKEKEKLEQEYESLKEENEEKEHILEVDNLKASLSYTDIKQDGLLIKIDAMDESVGNIAGIIDYNKILINIVNRLKSNGAKYIEINNQRINQYSEIILAGSHININSIPIAPPYEIKCVGDLDKLSNVYLEKSDNYIDNIQSNYPIKVDIKLEKNLALKKLNVPNKLKYIKDE